MEYVFSQAEKVVHIIGQLQGVLPPYQKLLSVGLFSSLKSGAVGYTYFLVKLAL